VEKMQIFSCFLRHYEFEFHEFIWLEVLNEGG
jgi:hypothetical protein